MSAREQILADIRARKPSQGAARPQPYSRAPNADDTVAYFQQRATAAAAQVRVLSGPEEIAASIAEILRARNLPAEVHLPSDAMLKEISWADAPGLSILHTVPNGDDVAINHAPFAIAETGTLVYPASPDRPASWHFRPGLEIAVLAANNIHANLEDILARLASSGGLPSTINLVTGPSRTGDIEQTLELGAHGPKELVILIVPSLGSDGI
ncbi:MAG TPA: LUD domain-containing protein [Rhizomicrobium sp.]|jgi:L-lactate dehydrogenase complex protein LldG